MSVTPSYVSYVVDQLERLGTVVPNRMFGGIGLYCDRWFFGLIDDDVLYLRVDDASRGEYVARGMPAFRPLRNKPELRSVNYYQVPGDVLEDAGELVSWARRALAVARAAPPKKRAKQAGKNGEKKPATEPARAPRKSAAARRAPARATPAARKPGTGKAARRRRAPGG